MPEGDTIHRTADRLRPVLVDQAITRFEARRLGRPGPEVGTTVHSVEARGKHLLIEFSDGWTLRTHLRMTGSWRVFAEGQRWSKPAHLARVVIEVDGWQVVCFSAPDIELVRSTDRSTALARLGPDLCRPDADLAECVARMGFVDPGTPVGDVLLDQRICNGVGNVYKSEVCFACRVDPQSPIASVDDAGRRELVETAARQLQANLGPTRRTTVAGPPGSLAVYGRARKLCRRCRSTIRVARTGAHARVTYWCPTCQPRRAAPGPNNPSEVLDDGLA